MKPITVMLECLNSRFPLASASGILDDGCGPGPIMTRIIEEFGDHLPAECTLICSDFAPAMVDQVQEAKARFVADQPESVWGRVRTEVLDCMNLATVGDGEMSHVAAGWVCTTYIDNKQYPILAYFCFPFLHADVIGFVIPIANTSPSSTPATPKRPSLSRYASSIPAVC